MSKHFTTWNYLLSFKGWAQCRMTTDPDPTNDPRGVSGYSFALPGEPDLSRIVYFQDVKGVNGVVHRSHCPPIGVCVTGGTHYKANVGADRQEQYETDPQPIGGDSPLQGATVDLLGQPVFDSRNSTLVYNGYGILMPFELEIQSADKKISFRRSYNIDPDNPTTPLESIPIDQLEPHIMNLAIYNSADLNKTNPGSADMLLESGVIDPVAYRYRRLQQLKADYPTVKDPVKKAALKKRIAELRIDDPVNRRTAQLGSKVLVPYNLNSKHAQVNKETIHAAGAPWSLEMWMGAWDTDALSFFVMGTVKIVTDFDPLAK